MWSPSCKPVLSSGHWRVPQYLVGIHPSRVLLSSRHISDVHVILLRLCRVRGRCADRAERYRLLQPPTYLPNLSLAKVGRIYTLWAFTTIFLLGAILTTIAKGPHGLAEIYAGRVISGIGIGAISAVSPAYVSECAPKEVRGRITGCFQIMVATGVMISYFINFGVGIHIHSGVNVWRIPFGFQLVPAGILALGLLTVKESPRWLASVGRNEQAVRNLAYLRKEPVDSERILAEMAEIEAAIEEERRARKGLGFKEAFLGKGNFIRFVIAFTIFFLQQWAGQNSVK
ncbi:hypothetical protein DXG03_002105 [Asterophora parasitica]|uniref:Major facilitator superfamily (MFS) profile domain-containing protein n=1 Tax=Asterophora parasitica TaxID=117018 RepID=A0A9P7G4R6_9AGAR|nr:hypothetical protein DXG03_002105 [Asterophora parasitica]